MLPRVMALLSCAAFAGCEAQYFRAETVLHADGSVTRTIYGPSEEIPTDVLGNARFQSPRDLERVDDANWPGTIRQVKPHGGNKKPVYVATEGRFDSGSEIPSHFRVADPDGRRDGRLICETERNDLGLVVVHVWRETLTDSFDLAEARRGRAELVDFLLKFAQRVFDERYGSEYDAERLFALLAERAPPLADDAVETLYQALLARRSGSLEERLKAIEAPMAAVFKKHGLPLVDERGSLLRNDALEQALRKHAAGLIQAQVLRRDDKPLSTRFGESVVDEMFPKETPAGEERPPSRIELAARRVVEAHYGGEEAFQQELARRLARVFGLYLSVPLRVPRRLRHQVEMPGMIVSTTGELLNERTAAWEFDDTDAFPLGYVMECRSLAADAALQQALFGKEPLRELSARREYVRWTTAEEALAEVMRKVATERRLAPLREFRAKKSTVAVERLCRLLGIE